MTSRYTRRQMLGASVTAAAGLGIAGARGGNLTEAAEVKRPDTMLKRNLGRTGHQVGIFSLGGEATLDKEDQQEEAVRIIRRALDRGVNYIDTAHIYGGGGSEKNIGVALEGRRDQVFLASKTRDRGYDGTMYQFETSLERLKTDHIDLYQLHNMRTQEDVDQAFAPNGALKAMEKLRDEGVVRFLGITGHADPNLLLRAISNYDFDCILMAINAADRHYMPFQDALLEKAVDKNMGIIAMKITARGRVFREGGVTSMAQALGYVWSLPISTAIVGITAYEEMEENIDLACQHQPLSAAQRARIESLIAPYEEEANRWKIRA